MATLVKAGTPTVATTIHDPGPRQIKGRAAQDLAAGDMVYMTSAGTLDKANGTAANALALAVGMVPKAYKSGEKAVAYFGVEFNYATGLIPGARYYVSATAGALDDAATVGGTVPVGFAVSTTDIYVLPPTR